jgi:hypothetical protein
MLGEIFMNTLTSKLLSALSSFVLLLSISTHVSAAELNLPGFSGTMNTTITSGVSMRLERNCLSVRGEALQAGDTGGLALAKVTSEQTAANLSLYTTDGEGCAERYTDGYGNTGRTDSGARNLIGANADNGRSNFEGGDIFDVTQRLYSEIVGSTDDGMSVNLSFVGTYNPLLDINGNPEFAPFSSKQQDEIETNLTLLNAYVTRDLNMDHSVTIGRFVTSWGESTFIPIGMNGLTTNAIDLSKLRNPGASIKEALIPTEQITFEGFLSDGWSYEAYLQMNEGHVEFEESGQFFGNEVVSGDRLIVSGQYSRNDQNSSAGCSFLNVMPVASGGQNLGCTQAALDFANTSNGSMNTDMYLLQTGIRELFVDHSLNGNDWSAANLAKKISGLALGATAGAATGFDGVGGEMTQLGFAYGSNVATAMAGWDEYDRKKGIKAGTIDQSGGNHLYADGEDQYGLSLRKFLPDVGTGIDLGFHFTQYDSKVPYLRIKGQGGIHAGDVLGILSLSGFSEAKRNTTMASVLVGGVSHVLTADQHTALNKVKMAVGNLTYSEAACGAYMATAAATDLYGARDAGVVYTHDEDQLALQAYNYTAIDGKLYHDAKKCYDNAQPGVLNEAGTAGTQAAAAGLLGGAITPLNTAEYEFIYPENLQAFGISANTNVGSTAVQLEITYRPDFPLATDGTDQGLQISDAVGTTNLLTLGVAQGAYLKASTAVVTAAYDAGNGNEADTSTWQDVLADISNFKRSTLPAITLATVADGDFYSTPYYEYDVISGTFATTSAFAASHPLTLALGADSTVLLSEVGFVSVPDLDASKAVARGGYRDGVGGDKCGGITKGGGTPTTFSPSGALTGLTHLASSQTDPLFGNGGYCEAKNNADDFAMTYRLIGSASYNNIANSPWNLSNSLVWSHDFNGYAPSSMGGFVPGRQSLSLSSTFTKGDVRASVSYVNQMGDEMDNLGFDMDYVSASMSYAF